MSAPEIQLVFAAADGKIYPYPGLEGVGMKAGRYERLDPRYLVPLSKQAELFLLPARTVVGYDTTSARYVEMAADPYSGRFEPCYPVAAFLPPGVTLTHNVAYTERAGSTLLPLFAYGTCVYYKGEFHASALPVDADTRHDERAMDAEAIRRNIGEFQRNFPNNRLIGHLGRCATVNACANAKNYFLGRYEAPIPTSPVCNAQCQGCISYQPPEHGVPPSQHRIEFTPTPEEIAEIALDHMNREPDPIVSFGQGCEGEPTLAGGVIERAIRRIRARSSKGSINLNTNAGRPDVVRRLFDAGLNSIRVSTNSVREPYYLRYYQPKGYGWADVTASIDAAKRAGGYVSLNYLTLPGFTDCPEEVEELVRYVGEHRVDMIQWRNLNYDPRQYLRDLRLTEIPEGIGIPQALAFLKQAHPQLNMGYFNPKKSVVDRASPD